MLFGPSQHWLLWYKNNFQTVVTVAVCLLIGFLRSPNLLLCSHDHLNFVEDALAFRRNETSHHLLRHILRAVAQQMLQLFRVELLNDLLLPLDDIRILLVECLESSLVFEQHFQQSSSPLQHFVQPVLQTGLETALRLWL